MAGPIYYDVAHGKPSTTIFVEYGEEKSVQHSVDLLRRYQFDFFILDRWNEGAPEDGEASSEAPVPLQLVEYSIDGSNYELAQTSRAIVCSDRSSPGTHRSLQVFFDTPVHARFFRITYPTGPWVYEMRANLRTYQAAAGEKSKIIESFDLPGKGALAESPVSAAIIGASNSVMRMGWTTGAAQAGIGITDNVSLGSSSNSMLATRLPAIAGNRRKCS